MLSGPLGGSLFNEKLFTRTQIWTSISTSQATKRQSNLFLRTILKSLVLLPWPIPHLRRLFLLLTSELLCLCLSDVGFIYLFIYLYIRFLFVGPGARDICSPSDTYLFIFFLFFYYLLLLFFLYIVCVLIVVLSLFSMIHMARIEDQSETNKLVKLSRCDLVD